MEPTVVQIKSQNRKLASGEPSLGDTLFRYLQAGEVETVAGKQPECVNLRPESSLLGRTTSAAERSQSLDTDRASATLTPSREWSRLVLFVCIWWLLRQNLLSPAMFLCFHLPHDFLVLFSVQPLAPRHGGKYVGQENLQANYLRQQSLSVVDLVTGVYLVTVAKLSKEHLADPFAKPDAALRRRAFELIQLRLSHLRAGSVNPEILRPDLLRRCDFFGHSYLFAQVNLGRSAAPSKPQVIHSEPVALERPGTLCSTLEGVECQNSSGAKHRSCTTTKSNAGACPQYLRKTRARHPRCRLLWSPLHHTIYMGKRVQNPRPIVFGIVYLPRRFRNGIARGESMVFVAEISNRRPPGFQVESQEF